MCNSVIFRIARTVILTPIILALVILLAPIFYVAFGCYIAGSMMQED